MNIPITNYHGSKFKLRDAIENVFKQIEFNTILDSFSGTSTIGYIAKKMKKQVFSNDILKSNYYRAKALIENPKIIIDKNDMKFILTKHNDFDYDNVIQRNFKDTYFTDKENEWLDIIVQNILRIENEYKKSVLFSALFRTMIMKRPFGLFHRKNLYIRLQNVDRSFGNKKTWDTPFNELFIRNVKEMNSFVFDNLKNNKAYNEDILNLEIPQKIDLIYIDPPYVSNKNTIFHYEENYHFLEGICDYYNWEKKINFKSKHRKLKTNYNIWNDKKNNLKAFENLIEKYKNSKIMISYREDGIPSIDEIRFILKKHDKKIKIFENNYQYVLSKNKTKEIIIIGD